MSKALKYLGIGLGVVLVFFIATAVLLSLFLSPKNLEKQIDTYLFKKTGQHLTIQGKSGLSFFPWIGFDAKNITLSSPASFENKPLAQIADLQVKVKLIPLLRGDIRIGNIVMKKANFNFITNKAGKSNWQNLTNVSTSQKKETKTSTNELAKKATPIAFSIAKINIQDANLNFKNEKTNEASQIKHFTLETTGINRSNNIQIKSSFQSSSSQSKTVNHLRFTGTLHVNPSEKTFKIDNLSLTNQPYTGNRKGAPLSLSGHLKGDLNQASFSINKMRVSLANLVLSGRFTASKLTSTPVYSVNFSSNKASIAQLTRALNGQSSGSGQIQINANITTSGSTSRNLIQHMQGRGKFSATGIALGSKVNSYIDQGISSSKHGRGKVKRTSSNVETISIWGPFQIKNGVLYNPQLSTNIKNPKIAGGGHVTLLTQRIQYTLHASTTLKLPPNHNIPITFPIYITGTLSNPQIKADIGKIAGQIAAYFLKNILQDTIKGVINGGKDGKVLPFKIPILGR